MELNLLKLFLRLEKKKDLDPINNQIHGIFSAHVPPTSCDYQKSNPGDAVEWLLRDRNASFKPRTHECTKPQTLITCL